jgi:hypothetical protein
VSISVALGGVHDAVALGLSHGPVLGCALQKRGTSATRINKHKEDTNTGNAVVVPELVDLPSSASL